MGSRFYATAGTLSQLRSETPRFHSVEQGGTTQLLDLVWYGDPAASTVYTLQDSESDFSPGIANSSRYWALHHCSRREPDAPPGTRPETFPGLMLHEVTTQLTSIVGQPAFRITRLVLAWVDPAAPAGADNAAQMLVASYTGADTQLAEGVTRFQVSAATGAWATATNLLVVPDPDHAQLRRIFVSRTLNEQAAATGAAPLETLATM
jgi:hypothetical protein